MSVVCNTFAVSRKACLFVGPNRSTQSVLKEASVLVSKKYDIHHTTIQVERFHEQMDNCSLCEEPKD